MKTKKSIILKVVSVIAILFIHIPSEKIPLPYGMGIFLTITERISEFDISTDLFLSLGCIIGLILLFMKHKWLVLLGYVLMITPLVLFVYNVSKYQSNLLFWIPLFLFMGLASLVLFQEFQKGEQDGSRLDRAKS
tara:strand:+ start:334 stop:738 length:405 start_codon:yes stop_codon:yes gene_type:complete